MKHSLELLRQEQSNRVSEAEVAAVRAADYEAQAAKLRDQQAAAQVAADDCAAAIAKIEAPVVLTQRGDTLIAMAGAQTTAAEPRDGEAVDPPVTENPDGTVVVTMQPNGVDRGEQAAA